MSNQKSSAKSGHQPSALNRRTFLAGTGAAAATFSIVDPQLARGYSANSKVNLGIIGCGGRGTWITNLFKEHGGYNIVAAADYFDDRVNAAGDKFGIAAGRRFSGLYGYRKMLEQGVDAVAIESPPYFHPEQAADAVEANCHVYVAKPIAVDVPGCVSIGESGATATKKKRCFLVDFQTRSDPFYMEALRRVRDGGIGKFVFGEATYHANCPFMRMYEDWKKVDDQPELRLRCWGLDRVLSGDIITEQNIHTLDVMSWIMNEDPICADGTGGRTVRPVGTCWDHFALLYQYPNNVGITFSSRQISGHGTQPEGIRNRMFGTEGVLETMYGGDTLIRGKHFYRGGKSPGIYKDGAVANIVAFQKNIIDGNYENSTVAPSVRSNLVTVLGRTAAYSGERVTWAQMMKSNEKLEANLKGLKT